MSDKDACSLKCIDMEFTVIEEMEEKHHICTRRCLDDLKNEPTPIGCFKDYENRNLRMFLGNDLSTEECIAKG